MIKIGYLISYDYNLLQTSLNTVYDYADKIFIAIDIERKTWSGNTFEIPNSFFEDLKKIDVNNKIVIYFENFFIPELAPIECETRERNMLLKKMGKGWKIQLDVDEYIYDFKVLKNYLDKYWYFNIFSKLTPIQFVGKLITLFKEVEDGFLYIDNEEKFLFITNYNKYTITRLNSNLISHYCNIITIHQSWAREESEIEVKIKNWGHKNDFDTMKYLSLWKNVNSQLYKEYINFHPVKPVVWNKLLFLPCKDINDFIDIFSKKFPQNPIPVIFFKYYELFLIKKMRKVYHYFKQK